MRCREVRKRLMETGGKLSRADQNNALADHLETCRECADWVQAEQILRQNLKLAAIDDNTDTIPMTELRGRVEKWVDLASQEKPQEINIMSAVVKQFRESPRLGVSIGLAVLILALVTLVPFKFERTVGYEVAIAGVNKDLALDSEKVDILLETIGVGEADFHVEGCEEACNIKITELKSEGDVQIVKAAFSEMGHCSIEEIKEICSSETSSLIGQARHKIFVKPTIKLEDEGNIKRVVIEKIEALKSDSCDFNIWIVADSNAGPIAMDIKSCAGQAVTADGDFVWQTLDSDAQPITIIVDESADNASYAEITTPDGEVHIIDLDAEYAEEELRKLGFGPDLNFLGEDNGNRVMLHEIVMTCDKSKVGESNNSRKVVKETPLNLPDGYDLSQNYPNPFNPDTRIDYSIPVAKHVKIDIFNTQGQKVRTLVDSYVESGSHTVRWDATTDGGDPVATGMYLYKFKAGNVTDTKKMLFIK